MKKTRRFKTRLIAGILSAITVFSVGTMAIGSASAFAIPGIAETVLYAKDEVMKLAGPELSKMGLSPILNKVLGLEDDGPSNQDILDKIDKSTEEIKAEINKVMDEVKELSTQTQGAFHPDSQLSHLADEPVESYQQQHRHQGFQSTG